MFYDLMQSMFLYSTTPGSGDVNGVGGGVELVVGRRIFVWQ